MQKIKPTNPENPENPVSGDNVAMTPIS